MEDVQRIINGIGINDLERQSFLISGGAGFLGSYLCDTLVKLKAEVTCLDNFSTGLNENVSHLFNLKNFRLLSENVSSFNNDEKYDFVLHLASRASPEDYQQHPVETLLANSLGSQKMLEIAGKNDSTILFTSSSEVYGDAKVVPTPESYWGNVNPVGVRSCYDEGKRFSEALFMAYYRQNGLDVKIVRIHNTYGPRLRCDGTYARAVSRFIMQALKNENITVYGDGKQTRSLCYVSDTITGILLALFSKKCKGEAINIGNPAEISVLELAELIKKVTNSSSQITFHPLPKDDPKRRCPNINKAASLLGWKPKVGLREGLDRTIGWFKKALMN